MALKIIDYLGSSMLVLLICFIIVDTFHSRRMSIGNAIGRIIILTILFIGLLRT